MGLLVNIFLNKCEELIPAPKCRSAEQIIINNKIRSCEVECKFNEVRYRFKENMIKGELKRWNILKIRRYLEKNVNEYEHKKFKNDAHAIYTMLKAKDIKVNDLLEVNKMLR